MNRKKFLQMTSLGLSSLKFTSFKTQAQKPIVVSTWDSGMPVNAAAWKILSANGRSLDAVEAGAMYMEDQINCCVGLGGYPDRDGIVTLDACIMDERANCGAVAGLERKKKPFLVGRKKKEKKQHVIMVGEGAQQIAFWKGFSFENRVLSKNAKKNY